MCFPQTVGELFYLLNDGYLPLAPFYFESHVRFRTHHLWVVYISMFGAS